MTTSPSYRRPTLDFDYNRQRAGELHSEMAHALFSKGVTALTPSWRTVRSFGLAFVVATGAFWAVMMKDPPKTIAADPNIAVGVFSPMSLHVPLDLPSGDYLAN